MKKTAIFYGPPKGSVAKVAGIVAEAFAPEKVDMIEVKSATPRDVERYDNIVFGLSTIGKANWDSEHVDDGWDLFLTQIEKIDWSHKKVAIFSLGDQVMYSRHFVDALGWMYDRLVPTEARVVGFCKPEGYHFTESEGLRDGLFPGLPIDEDNEPEKTPERVKKWVEKLKKEFTTP